MRVARKIWMSYVSRSNVVWLNATFTADDYGCRIKEAGDYHLSKGTTRFEISPLSTSRFKHIATIVQEIIDEMNGGVLVDRGPDFEERCVFLNSDDGCWSFSVREEEATQFFSRARLHRAA